MLFDNLASLQTEVNVHRNLRQGPNAAQHAGHQRWNYGPQDSFRESFRKALHSAERSTIAPGEALTPAPGRDLPIRKHGVEPLRVSVSSTMIYSLMALHSE